MGITNVDLTIKNQANPKEAVTREFLVDSGASFTVIPKDIVDKLKLKPNFYREFMLADGKKMKRAIGSAVVGFGNEEISVPVVLGEKNDNALLGAITLEAFGLVLDPFQRKLYKAQMTL
jgi:clan AA aspartic protease